ncbi:MAG: hypothetical protein JWR77_2648 [Rhizorhabdus sp.]|nr:hypothetical protein [Rhizorhabdus sp.]
MAARTCQAVPADRDEAVPDPAHRAAGLVALSPVTWNLAGTNRPTFGQHRDWRGSERHALYWPSRVPGDGWSVSPVTASSDQSRSMRRTGTFQQRFGKPLGFPEVRRLKVSKYISKGMRVRWNDEDLARLRALAGKMRPGDLAGELSRSAAAIAIKACELGISLRVARTGPRGLQARQPPDSVVFG